jgi:hypothetical protein
MNEKVARRLANEKLVLSSVMVSNPIVPEALGEGAISREAVAGRKVAKPTRD